MGCGARCKDRLASCIIWHPIITIYHQQSTLYLSKSIVVEGTPFITVKNTVFTLKLILNRWPVKMTRLYNQNSILRAVAAVTMIHSVAAFTQPSFKSDRPLALLSRTPVSSSSKLYASTVSKTKTKVKRKVKTKRKTKTKTVTATPKAETKSTAKSNSAIDNDYGAGQITVLEGLDPVRKRPGMYVFVVSFQSVPSTFLTPLSLHSHHFASSIYLQVHWFYGT